jgi:hypothetical protein
MTQSDPDVVLRERLARVWRASAPMASEIAELRGRLASTPKRPRRARGKMIAAALIQGLMFGGATLAAAAWMAGHVPRFVHHGAGTSLEPALAARNPSAGSAAHEHAVAFDVAGSAGPLPHASVPESEGAPRHFSPTPHDVRKVPEARRSPGEATILPSEESPVDVASASTTSPEGPWKRVARALSVSDWTRADQALSELSSTADPATRDAADLARAELRIAHGEGTALRPELARLARSGATALIRKRAARLLQRVP